MKKILVGLIIGSILIISCRLTKNEVPFEPTPIEKELIDAFNKFGIKLFKEINEVETEESNIFISPLSVSMALGMAYNGARDSTERAMRNVLEFGELSRMEINESYRHLYDVLTRLDESVIFEIANSIWYERSFNVKDSFIDINRKYFDAEVSALDFSDPSSVDIINNWVKEKTHNKIERIVDRISPDEVMFLINAIYFKGIWTYKFDEDATQEDYFYLQDGSRRLCEFMEQTIPCDYFENDEFQAVSLSYGRELFRMMIILPQPGIELDAIISSFTMDDWVTWIEEFKECSVNVIIPKFKFKYEDRLNDVLTNLGMGIAFTPGADFNGISEENRFWISRVLHKTFVQVDEEGTEAAAVTTVGFGIVSPIGVVFRADHPFLFIIYESYSNTILFIGKLVDPVWEDE